MVKYRKKVPLVEAVQFDPQAQVWPAGVIPWKSAGYQPRDMSWGYIEVNGERDHVKAGDWLVREGDGKIHLWSDYMFRAHFESVDVLSEQMVQRIVEQIVKHLASTQEVR